MKIPINLKLSIFLIILTAIFTINFVYAQSTLQNLTITEIMPNPIGDDSKFEWIELTNYSSEQLNLNNFKINNKALPDSALDSGDTIILVRDIAEFSAVFGNISAIKFDFSLVNSGGALVLENLDGMQIQKFEYGQAEEGKSFELLLGECNLIKINILSHTVGKTNTSCQDYNGFPTTYPTIIYSTTNPLTYKTLSDNIVLYAINPNPSTGDEWVEIKSNDSEAINLDSWKITDDSTKVYIIKGIVINPGAVIRISPKSISLNNTGDTVNIIDINGKVVDTYTYGNTTKDEIIFIYETHEQARMLDVFEIDTINQSEKNLSSIVDNPNRYNKYLKKPILYTIKDYIN